MPVRVRIAPSPTGYFHVGTARTALFNWLFARQNSGVFVLRVEDTDVARNKAEFTEGIERAMRWLGLDWDEGPYFQSERTSLYEEAIAKLLASGNAYACDCKPDDVQARAKAAGRPPGYDGHCRDRGLDAGPGTVIRFRTPDIGTVSWADMVREEVSFEAASVEDFAIRKSNGQPLFILANAVDDADMGITHVIRGEDHVSNTPKYLMVWEALGFGQQPTFAHLPLLVNEARKKLSKRRDKVALEDYRDDGYMPEAMVHYLALLGWSPAEEKQVISVTELIDEFSLDQVRPSPAFFDERKLSSVNEEHLRALSVEEMSSRSADWLETRWKPIAHLVQERARTFADVYSMVDFLFLPLVGADMREWERLAKKQPAVWQILEAAEKVFAECDWNAEALRVGTVAAGESAGVPQLNKSQAPIRLAVTGRLVGPPLFESMELLGRRRVLERIAASRALASHLSTPQAEP